MSLISVLKSGQSTSRLGGTWWQCMAPGVFKTPDCRQWFRLEQGSIPAFHNLHHPSLCSHSLALPRSVKYFPLEDKGICKPLQGKVCVCRSAAHHLLPLEQQHQGCARSLWLGFPSAPSHCQEGQAITIYLPSAEPFLWAMGFLCWYPLCNSTALYFPLPLFGINPIIF